MRRLNRLALILAAAALSACATAPVPPPSPPPPSPQPPPAATAPDFAEPAALAPPGRSLLYTDCLAQAIDRSAVARVSRDDADLLRFTCIGAPAQRFYEALGVADGKTRTAWSAGGRTFRATSEIRSDLFGADYCSAGPGGATCQISFNAGPFLTPGPGF